jgi:pimeloyl-ACP methyl ester carboxylesterase
MRFHLCGALAALSALAPALLADPPAQPMQTESVRPPRVVLLRGGLGVFSRGLDVLADRCRAEGMSVSVHPHTSWQAIADQLAREGAGGRQPLVLIGHSWGADAVLHIAARLEGRQTPVALAVTLESVNTTRVPDNIRMTLNLYCPKGPLGRVPLWRGIPVYGNSQTVENINVRERPDVAPSGTAHGSIDDSPQVHHFIIERIHRLNGKAETAPAVSAESSPQATPPPAGESPASTTSYVMGRPATVEIPPLWGRAEQALQISGPAPEAPHQVARPDSAYSPTVFLQGAATPAVVGQPTSRSRP